MASAVAGCMAVSDALAPNPVTLTTGTPGGIYHPVGSAICQMFNLEGKHQAMPCVAVSSDGSVANIRRVESGDSTFGLSQTDVAYAAFHGEGPFAAAGPDPKLRILIALYPEAFTVVARADTGIRDFQDLRGKRVGIGTSGVGYNFLAMSSSDLMARRYPILSVCWNSRPPNRTRRFVATKSTRSFLKRGIPMG
jgi:hypothetical protein